MISKITRLQEMIIRANMLTFFYIVWTKYIYIQPKGCSHV
jgi:hypothetical protein